MDENDPVNVKMKMYEAQTEAFELKRELERKEKELKAARREIERLRTTNQQLNFRYAVAEMEQTFNAKFLEMNEKFELQLSKLQQTADEKAAGDLRMIENQSLHISNLQNSIDERIAEFIQYKEENNNAIARINRKLTEENKTKELVSISSRSDNLKLNLNASVILLGGVHAGHTDSICMFNSKENKWINSHFKLPDKLGYHGSVILNGEIYIFGGWNGKEDFKSTYKLGENGEWIKLADMNEKRSQIERSSVVFEDEIWVFGGQTDTCCLRTVEKYNKQRNIWIKMPEMREARSGTAVSIINGKFYVSGGFGGKPLDTIEVYDPEKEKWEIFNNLPFALYRHTSIADGTNLIIIGGRKSDNKPSAEVNKNEKIFLRRLCK